MKLKLYDYLETKYSLQDDDYKDYNTFDEFIMMYLDALVISNEAMFETVFEDKVTYHYRNFDVNHKTRTIDILFMDEGHEEDW